MNKKRTQAKSRSAASDCWSFPEMNRALEVALYYGFSPVEPLPADKHAARADGIPAVSAEEKTALLKHYFAKGQPPLPIATATALKPRERGKKLECSFDVIGTPRPIADATVIKAAYDVVRSDGFEEPLVELNSIGDRESFGRFLRDLGAYFKKVTADLDPECKQALKKGPLEIVSCDHEKCRELKDHAPHPMNYLSEPSRAHFMELLELLETTGIPYVINNQIIDCPTFATHTLFRIYGDSTKKELVASGCRWATLGKKIGLRKDVPSVSATVLIEKPAKSAKAAKVKKPQFYFVQMGHEAKLKSLHIIDTLRQCRIPLYHSLLKDKLGAQLSSAESLGVPYVLIMGQKESVEETVLIREMSNRSQETVRISEVGDYLRKLLT